MAKFRISGVWKDKDAVITHYAFHEVFDDGTYRAKKTSKPDAIALLETKGNSAMTWIWDYTNAKFKEGEKVLVVGESPNKYLRTVPDGRLNDNLGHLIDFDWIAP